MINRKLMLIVLLFTCFMFLFPSISLACTYKATISGNHLDFSITSDLDKLAVIQYIKRSGSAYVLKMYSPSNVGAPWTYFDDPNCNIGLITPIGCRQNRSGGLGGGAFWQWYEAGSYHVMPGDGWGLDFNIPPTYESLGIEYGTTGGGEAWTWCTRTGDVQLPSPSPTETPSPTPTPTPLPTPAPTQSPSPSPSPSPTPSPISITKVVFIPGMGGSWNTNAFVNCKSDPDPTHWTLATFAESIYKPIMSAIEESGWKLQPFYYDWREQIPTNSNLLENIINLNTVLNEKVNVVGHSMGGLVGRSYLENTDGMKVNKFLTAGSPHQGAVQAYPAWAGGDIWQDNFVEKIALNLYLKHCGGYFSNNRETIQNFVPSTQNLLPIFPYLKSSKSETKFLPVSQINRNNWLPTSISNFSSGVKMETLSGFGFDTLQALQIKDPSSKDLKGGDWIDGRPTGKIFTEEGDGTVLSASSKLPGVQNVSLNQSHSGLISSIEGMGEILRFLGKDSILNLQSNSLKVDSAIILIGYPSNFWVSDQRGHYYKDKDGVVSLINPKSGNYKLNLIPKSNDTVFVATQFMPNGDIKYKEYHLKGYGPKFKTIKFDLQNPQDDLLN